MSEGERSPNYLQKHKEGIYNSLGLSVCVNTLKRCLSLFLSLSLSLHSPAPPHRHSAPSFSANASYVASHTAFPKPAAVYPAIRDRPHADVWPERFSRFEGYIYYTRQLASASEARGSQMYIALRCMGGPYYRRIRLFYRAEQQYLTPRI